jgi:hypothetical protein
VKKSPRSCFLTQSKGPVDFGGEKSSVVEVALGEVRGSYDTMQMSELRREV